MKKGLMRAYYKERPMRYFLISVIAAALALASVAEAKEQNRPGFARREGVNQEAVVIATDPKGCPIAGTDGAQHMRADEVARFVEAAAAANAHCVRAQADATVAATLAQAGATVAITAAAQGHDVYVDTDGEVATGPAARFAAMQRAGMPIGLWPNQAAMDVAALQAINGGGFLPPPPAPPPPPPPRPRAPSAAEVAAAEASVRAAAAQAASR